MAKRNAVVVTHTRLRQTGTVVAEAVSQLRVAGLPEPGMRHHHRVALGHGIILSIRSHCSLF